jgi:hypothetical protein
MRFGFVAASLTAHAAVVCLAWRFAPVGERAATPRETSGLPSDELEVTPWEPETASDDAVRREASARDVPAVDKAHEDDAARTSADATPLATVTPAREGAPPKIKTPPLPKTATKPAVDAAERDADNASKAESAAREVTEPRPARANRADDWMSLDDQLPESAEGHEAAKPTTKPPERDVLVERLLAKERDKARLAARDEARRAEAEREEATKRAAQPPPTATVGEPNPRNPEDDNFGDNRAHADLWVELTRWLPRAASSDRAWEELPANSSYEFRVELVTEGGKLVDSRLLDSAPLPTNKLLTNTSHLMERGKYGGSKRVKHRFELRIRLSTTEPRDLWIAHTTPDPPKPGVGSFIAPSGRRFDVWVTEIE